MFMKSIKLLLVFLVGIGIIAGIIWFGSIGDDKSKIVPDIDLPDLLKDDVEEISEEWAEKEGWDADLYERQKNAIEQKIRINYYDTESGGRLILEGLDNIVCNKLHDALMYEFHSQDCRNQSIENNMTGIRTLCQSDGSYRKDARVNEVTEIYGVYKSIIEFYSQSFLIIPDIDFESNEWTPFANYESKVNAQKESFLNNEIYREHIKGTRVKSGLDGVDAKLIRAKEIYYNDIENAIIVHFNGITPYEQRYTSLNLSTIKKLLVKLTYENKEINDDLKDFIDAFEVNVNEEIARKYFNQLKDNNLSASQLEEIGRWINGRNGEMINDKLKKELKQALDSYSTSSEMLQ